MPSPVILLIGTTGQVGHALHQRLRAWQASATGQGAQLFALNRQQLDLAHPAQIRNAIRSIRPTLIINAAAYTAVDQAESEPALAHRINADAPAVMAQEARRHGAALIHYSTDYVFDGSRKMPYTEADTPNPVNLYGRSKLSGEQAIQAAGMPHLILRTSWVYGWHGHNFLRTILLLAQQQPELRIVNDQVGTPTWSGTLADATLAVMSQLWQNAPSQDSNAAENWWQDHGGLYHCTPHGQTTWFGFAQQILAQTPQTPQLTEQHKPVLQAIATIESARRADRPLYSVMACNKFDATFFPLPEWRSALQQCMASKPTIGR